MSGLESIPTPRELQEADLGSLQNSVPVFDDGRFFVDEMDLDDMLNSGRPLDAIQTEERLLEEVRSASHISSALAHATLKAIAIAQAGRQFYETSTDEDDSSYKNLGMLLDKSLASRSSLYRLNQEDAFTEAGLLTGIVSEISVYALAAYNNTMSHPLSSQVNGARPRYVLPSTRSEDRGRNLTRKKSLKKRTGYDLKVTYLEGDNPERLLQVKTNRDSDGYIPSIIIVPLRRLAFNPTDLSSLPRAIATEAKGQGNSRTRREVQVASRRLNRII